MNCLEFHEWLHARLDGTVTSPPAAAAEHLKLCADCRELFDAARRLSDGLTTLSRPESSALLTQSIVAGVLEDRRRRQRSARRRLAFTLSMAAAILLMFLVGRWWSPPKSDGPVIVKKNSNQGPAPAELPQLVRGADEARAAVARLGERVKDQTKEQARVLIAVADAFDFAPMANLPGLQDLEEPLDPAAKSLRQATVTVASDIEPIANSARRAVEFFVKEMPMFEIPQKN